MLKLFFAESSDKAVPEKIRIKGKSLPALLARKLTFFMIKLQAKIQTEFLSGQVLEHRTGKLINSIRTEGAHQEGDSLIGTVQGAGGVAWYGIVHEQGGKGPYEIRPVNKKALAFFPSGTAGTLITKADLRKMYSGPMSARSLKPSKFGQFSDQGGVVVKSVMHPALPKRPFMVPALEDMAQEIYDGLQTTVNESIQ
jgi:hypothetical protein